MNDNLYRFLNLIGDTRMPFYLPYNILKTIYVNNTAKKDIKFGDIAIKIALTFDVEYDYGSSGNKNKKALNEFFADKFDKLTSNGKIATTLFVQGDLIEELKTKLNEAALYHEIGLHGYEHELWGNPVWFLKDKYISENEKEKLLIKSIEIFEKNELKKPVSFRAPNMIINKKALRLLNKYGFTSDSSLPSYLGYYPCIDAYEKPVLIPITVNPKPYRLFPFTKYKVFNLFNIIRMSEGDIVEYVNEIIAFQIAKSNIPHLVFLAHSWEFSDLERFGYCTNENVNKFKNFINILKNNYNTEFVKIKDILK